MTRARRAIRRALRVAYWNALLLILGAALIATGGEIYLRLTKPFVEKPYRPVEFVPNVGRIRPPNTEIRHSFEPDLWNVSRTNSLGFSDREPPSPERAAATCHISIVGDSFVEALEVPIEDKFQAQLEKLAPPRLHVTTSAFGITNTGQVQQLPLYDEYVRRLHPKLLVLVFVNNDFSDNTPFLRAFRFSTRGPQRLWEPLVRRRSDGELELAWPSPQDRLPSSFRPQASWAARAMKKAVDLSYFAFWLRDKKNALFRLERRFLREMEALGRQPGSAALLEGWRPRRWEDMVGVFGRRDLPPFFEDALQYTAFALEQFRERADRDGAKMVILASYTLTTRESHIFERLSRMAATLGIPVISQADYVLRQGVEPRDAHWPDDYHWNPAGHRWAAEALLEYIEEHPAICGRPTGAATLLEPAP